MMDIILNCVSQSDLSVFSESLLLFFCWFVAQWVRMIYSHNSCIKVVAEVGQSSYGRIMPSVLYP